MAFTGIDYQDLKTSLYYQRQRKLESHLTLRHFTDLTQWQNPGGIPAEIGPDGLVAGQQPYLENMPREQSNAVREIRDLMAKSRLGRQLLIIADQGHIQFGFTNAGPGKYEAAYAPGARQVLFNGDGDLFKTSSAREFIARATLFGAHELGHVLQDYAAGDGGHMDLDMSASLPDRILGVRHMEAAAVACSIQVAWDVKEAGDESLWAIALKTPGERSAALAFGRLAVNDPAAARDGRARRLAHDDWFKDLGRMDAYDQSNLDRAKAELEMLAAQQAAGFPDPDARAMAATIGKFMVGTSAMVGYTSMPDGIEHMNLPGAPRVDDPQYCALPNKRIAAQMAHLQKVAAKFRNNEAVTAVDFERYEQIGAAFANSTFASKQKPDADHGHPLNTPRLHSWRIKRENAGAPAPLAGVAQDAAHKSPRDMTPAPVPLR